jgi:hypothetical protein
MSKAVFASATKPLFYGFIIFISVQPILYWTISKSFAQGHKVFFYGIIVAMTITILKNRSLVKDNLIIFIGFYSIWLIALGLAINPIGKATFAHLQPILLPILGINFGYLIARDRPDILAKIYSGSYILGLVLTAIIVSYYLLYKAGLIAYFGASSLIFIPIFWAFLEKKWTVFILFVFILFLTGKRSSTLAVGAVLLFSLLRHLDLKQILAVSGAATFFWIGVGFFSDFFSNLFQRYLPIVEAFNWSDIRLNGFSAIDLKVLDVATSGRINDFLGAVNALNENLLFWFTGKGIGGMFEVYYPNAAIWITHYSHFTPISYVFLGGVIMLIAVYGKLISLLFYSLKTIDSFYSMLFVYWFIMALIGGAIYFTDPFIWLFIGVVIHQKKHHNSRYQSFYSQN